MVLTDKDPDVDTIPWDQDHIVYVPMIPFGDTSTCAAMAMAGLQPVVPQLSEHQTQPTIEAAEIEVVTAATTTEDDNVAEAVDNVNTRELHNEIERKRRLRIKQCCDILRHLIPGLTDKTDKATVLEHTVDFVDHLFKCPNHKCVCYDEQQRRNHHHRYPPEK